jgi:CheY-like chemotaxis protein
VLNLIDNAVRYTDCGAITMRCTVAAEQFSIVVADTGIGIESARLARIFQPFGQSERESERENDPARREGGTGLGLSIAHQLAHLLGGSIAVESTPGAGSRFTLTLPGSLVEPLPQAGDDAPFSAAPPVRAALPPLEPARILLAEDHALNRTVIRELLEHCGQSVAVAHDGNEAIAMVFESVVRGRPFDLVLMDVEMPGCDGRAAARTIRQEGIGPEHLPIIALSAQGFVEDRAALRAAGMQDRLAKPVELTALARMLQRWMPTRIIDLAHADDEGERDRFAGGARATLRSAR